MYYLDHNPPHFHAEYQGHKAEYNINTLELIVGDMPRRANSLILEWASIHREELVENWQLARAQEELIKITPLD